MASSDPDAINLFSGRGEENEGVQIPERFITTVPGAALVRSATVSGWQVK